MPPHPVSCTKRRPRSAHFFACSGVYVKWGKKKTKETKTDASSGTNTPISARVEEAISPCLLLAISARTIGGVYFQSGGINSNRACRLGTCARFSPVITTVLTTASHFFFFLGSLFTERPASSGASTPRPPEGVSLAQWSVIAVLPSSR